MRIDTRFINWGIFFILLGGVPLAVQQGLIGEEALARWWSFWPLLLIAAGIGVLLSRTPLEFVGGLLAAATFGLMGGALLAGGFGNVPSIGCGDEGTTTPFEPRSGELGSVASVSVDLNCGELTVVTGSGSTWRVEGADDDGEGPRIEADSNGLVVRNDDRDGPFGFLGRRDTLTLTLPTDPTLEVDIGLNAGSGVIDLRDATLDRLDVEANAGDVRLDLTGVAALRELHVGLNAGRARATLPEADLSATFEANAGAVDVCVPSGAGVRIRLEGGVAVGHNLDERGLVERGETWETPDFESAGLQIEIEAEANAGSFNLDPDGGCGA